MKAILYHRKNLHYPLDFELSWANLREVATVEISSADATVAQLCDYAHDSSAGVDWREHPAPGVIVENLTFTRVTSVSADDGRRGDAPCIGCGFACDDHIAPENLCPVRAKRITIAGDVIKIGGAYFRLLENVWQPIPEPLPAFADRTREKLGLGAAIIGGAKPT